ncbi:hypothetical protein AAVH_17522, partial [Aphelenchoides avenae]
MYAPSFTDPFAKVATHIGKLVDVRTNKCLSCGFQLKPGCEVGHYKVEHFYILKEIVKQIEDEPFEGNMALQRSNTGGDTSSTASINQPQMSAPSNVCGASGAEPQHRPPTASVAPRTQLIKQELLPRDADDDVAVTSDQAAAPFFVKSHGLGFRVLIRDTKNLSQENVNILLSLLTPPERASAANAFPRLKFEPLNTGGTRIEVEDTGLLTATQLAAVRRAISGTTNIDIDGQAQERMCSPSVP